MADSILTSVVGVSIAAVSWVALNFVARPVLAVRDDRRKALEVAERYAYVGLHGTPSEEYHKRALMALHDAGGTLRAHGRERSLAVRAYCRILGYDLDFASRAILGLGEALRGEYHIDEGARRITLHAVFVALGSTHHLTAAEVTAVSIARQSS